MKYQTVCLMAITILNLCTAGCSQTPQDQPDLGQVTGQVLLDGQPVEKLLVTFIPDEGRPSSGVTDELGNYELAYVGTDKGAKIGHHIVQIATLDVGEPERPKKEIIPGKYNLKTELTADVVAGPNEIDFAISSK